MEFDYGIYQDLVEQKKQDLLESIKPNFKGKDYEVVRLAFTVASHAHYTQKRKSGEPYITHPTEVATILAKWGLDAPTIGAALLHDVIEDTTVNKADLTQIFGTEIAELVDGVTKLEKIHFESEEVAHAEYFRKVVLAMAKDIRVIIIKLADRLHNMLTLSSMTPEKRRRIALETIEIYAPIANKIGLHRIYLELADECFKNLHPLRYRVLTRAVASAQKKRLPIIEEILHNIKNGLRSNGISADYVYRQRTIYNLYRRMMKRHQSFNRIYDIFEIKIIVKTIRDCYLTMGVLHSLYQPIPGKFKDYIAIPKNNGYQSLHSTLMGPHGTPLQLHIRTFAMDAIAENGIISHWLNHQQDSEFLEARGRTTNWINNILDIQSGSFSANEFLESIKQDLSPGDIYVFSPKGKIIVLPKGSTPIDFAFAIHTDVGNHCNLALVNQKNVKLDTKLQNGDIIEIQTKDNVEPNETWLDMVVSGRAISRIKQYLKEQKFDDNVQTGLQLLQIALTIFSTKILPNDKLLDKLAHKYYPRMTVADMLHNIGVGKIAALEAAGHMLTHKNNEIPSIKLSECIIHNNSTNTTDIQVIQDPECLPLPGDSILAKITKQKELLLHAKTCKQNKNTGISSGNMSTGNTSGGNTNTGNTSNGLENLTLIHIVNDTNKVFFTKVHVLISNALGTFTKFAGIIAKQKINIVELTQEIHSKEFALIHATLGVHDRHEVDELAAALSSTNFVEKITLT